MVSTACGGSAPIENTSRVNLLGLPEAKLVEYFASIGEKRFRATQVLKWIHQLGAETFDDMTNISKDLRDRKSTRLNSSHVAISYAVFCLKKKKTFVNLQQKLQQYEHNVIQK